MQAQLPGSGPVLFTPTSFSSLPPEGRVTFCSWQAEGRWWGFQTHCFGSEMRESALRRRAGIFCFSQPLRASSLVRNGSLSFAHFQQCRLLCTPSATFHGAENAGTLCNSPQFVKISHKIHLVITTPPWFHGIFSFLRYFHRLSHAARIILLPHKIALQGEWSRCQLNRWRDQPGHPKASV